MEDPTSQAQCSVSTTVTQTDNLVTLGPLVFVFPCSGSSDVLGPFPITETGSLVDTPPFTFFDQECGSNIIVATTGLFEPNRIQIQVRNSSDVATCRLRRTTIDLIRQRTAVTAQ